MTAQSNETQIALLILRQTALEQDLEEANDKIKAIQAERDKALKWGVMTLGAAVISMVVWIANKVIGGQIH